MIDPIWVGLVSAVSQTCLVPTNEASGKESIPKRLTAVVAMLPSHMRLASCEFGHLEFPFTMLIAWCLPGLSCKEEKHI